MNQVVQERPLSVAGELPGEGAQAGDIVNCDVFAGDGHHEKSLRLTKKIAEGGEGSVFETSVAGFVAKIYKRDKITSDRRAKLDLLIGKRLVDSSICLPKAIVLNSRREFVGYLMRSAKGYELGKSVFQPKLFQQRFCGWNRMDSIDLCITILEIIKVLNDAGIILGDINPANILIVSPGEVYFVDCDSYQVGGYPCPVGTVNFTPPEIQGRDYKTFLRTQEMENYAIATLMFMIMLPGKPPYSGVGGESPAKNIKAGNFPYPHKDTQTDNLPPGKWGFIWSHMSYKMRLAFYETFKKGEKHFDPKTRYDAGQWLREFKLYREDLKKMVQNDPMSIEIFPSREKMKPCKKCQRYYVPDRNHYTPLCPECMAKEGKSKNKKLCPYCKKVYVPLQWDYCNDCRDVVVGQRECVNCHKSFDITAGLERWEKEHGATKKRCPICSKAGRVDDPCKHASPETNNAERKVSPSGGNKASRPQNSAPFSGLSWWARVILYTFLYFCLPLYLLFAFMSCS